MSDVLKKLNLKDQKEILILNAPESFEPELAALSSVTIRRRLQDIESVTFSLAFVKDQKEIDTIAPAVTKKVTGDAVVWFAYPKGTSKKYQCAINRDRGWTILGKSGFEVVRQVAIDEDWSALRFRQVKFIATMTRDGKRAMTRDGKSKAARK
jgi:hypothetical protein